MTQLYAGLDVSLEMTSICNVNAEGRIISEAKVVRNPKRSLLILSVFLAYLSVSGLRPAR